MVDYSVKQMQYLLAMLEKECPKRERLGMPSVEVTCSRCNGSGRLSLLPEVREPCSYCRGEGHVKHAGRCPLCHGLGWVSTEDGWVWTWVLRRYSLLLPDSNMYQITTWQNLILEDLLLFTMNRATNYAEAEAWVREYVA